MPLVLHAGDAVLSIDVERGGRISSLTIDGRELLLGPPGEHDAGVGWGCFLMAPWAGRIENGLLEWDGTRATLPTTTERHALHGLVYDRPWAVVSQDRDEAVLRADLGPAWPFGGTVEQRFELREDGLSVTAELTAERATPAVLGWHPWFRSDGGEPRVTLVAATTLEAIDKIPTGRLVPVDPRTDLDRGAPILGRALDDAYPNVDEPAFVEWDDLTLRIELEPRPATFVVYTAGDAFCVEPQTAWPNAIPLAARGVDATGVVEVAPGERFAAEMTWRWAETPTDFDVAG